MKSSRDNVITKGQAIVAALLLSYGSSALGAIITLAAQGEVTFVGGTAGLLQPGASSNRALNAGAFDEIFVGDAFSYLVRIDGSVPVDQDNSPTDVYSSSITEFSVMVADVSFEGTSGTIKVNKGDFNSVSIEHFDFATEPTSLEQVGIFLAGIDLSPPSPTSSLTEDLREAAASPVALARDAQFNFGLVDGLQATIDVELSEVSVSEVPVPATLWLIVSSIGGLAAVRFTRSRRYST